MHYFAAVITTWQAIRSIQGTPTRWILAGLIALAADLAAVADTNAPPRVTAALDTEVEHVASNAWSRGMNQLYQQQPSGPIVWPPPPPLDPSLQALSALDTATNEFEAPPLIVTRISALPAASGLSATQVVERFERNMLRERVIMADRMFRQGEPTNAVALLQDLNKYLRNPRNRGLSLNRMAAYEFRQQNYELAAVYMQQALDAQNQDVVTKINLSAVLMTMGKVDQALGTLLELYPTALDRLPLMFSVHFNLACVYSLKKETDKALQNLAIAAQTDPSSTLASIGDPQLDFIRTDSRFPALVQALDDYVKQNPRR